MMSLVARAAVVVAVLLSSVADAAANVEASTTASPFTWITLGDWGGATLNGGKKANSQDYQNVMAVAAQMAKTAKEIDPKFIIGTGDNFYWCGIQNTSDFQIEADFLEPYADPALALKWYSSLGNHEYGYNVQAQIDYSKINPNWVLPSRYYTERITLDAAQGAYASLIVIDSAPCVQQYRNDDPTYWDPCSSQYPTCSLSPTDDDFEGPCFFHDNILSQDCAEQFAWFGQALAAVPEGDWKIIVGHHPADEIDVADFTSLLQKHGWSIYLNGHAHALTHYTIDYGGAYVTSGAGALVNTADQSNPVTAVKVRGHDIAGSLPVSAEARAKHAATYFSNTASQTTPVAAESVFAAHTHSYQTVYNVKEAGFVTHAFNADYTNLTTSFISYTGAVLHSFVTDKSGKAL